MRYFMDKNQLKKFLDDLKIQLLDYKYRAPDNFNKIGFGITDSFSPEYELSFISELQELLDYDSENDFSELIENYKTLFKLHPNLKLEYKRLKQIPKLQKSIIDESNKIKNKIDSICFSCRKLSDISNSINFNS